MIAYIAYFLQVEPVNKHLQTGCSKPVTQIMQQFKPGFKLHIKMI